MTQKEIVYGSLSYKLTGLLMRIQQELGRFCKEKQYADLLETSLKNNGIDYKRECVSNFEIGNEVIKGNRVDFIVDGKVLIELKSVPFLTKRDYYQAMRYLRAANLKLALLVNMRSEYLKPKRILNSMHHSH